MHRLDLHFGSKPAKISANTCKPWNMLRSSKCILLEARMQRDAHMQGCNPGSLGCNTYLHIYNLMQTALSDTWGDSKPRNKTNFDDIGIKRTKGRSKTRAPQRREVLLRFGNHSGSLSWPILCPQKRRQLRAQAACD